MSENVRSLKQQRLIGALLTQRTIGEAARVAGLSERQVGRYLADPEFSQALSEAQGIALSSLLRALVGLGEKAVQALSDALEPEQDVRSRVRAADILLGRLVTYREMLSLEERIVALEAALQGGR